MKSSNMIEMWTNRNCRRLWQTVWDSIIHTAGADATRQDCLQIFRTRSVSKFSLNSSLELSHVQFTRADADPTRHDSPIATASAVWTGLYAAQYSTTTLANWTPRPTCSCHDASDVIVVVTWLHFGMCGRLHVGTMTLPLVHNWCHLCVTHTRIID